jgi:hypothetical protein
MHRVRIAGLLAKRWPVLLGVLLVAASGVLLAPLWWSPWESRQLPEPVYNGKPLNYWLAPELVVPRQPGSQLIFDHSASYHDPPESLRRDSNAVPFLIRLLRRDSWFGAAYYRKWIWPRLPASIRQYLPPPPSNYLAREGAAFLLTRMNNAPARAAAAPALIRALKKVDAPNVQLQAALALSDIAKGNSSVAAALTEALGDKDPTVPVRYYNAQYDFTFFLPASWRGYSVLHKEWQGTIYVREKDETVVVATGPVLVFRHPKWTASKPYQDMTIVIYTRSQWYNERLGEGGCNYFAGGTMVEVCHNASYVFAMSTQEAKGEDNGWQDTSVIVSQNIQANEPLLAPP